METISTNLVLFHVNHQVLAIEKRLVTKVITGPRAIEFVVMMPPEIGFFRKKRVHLIDLKAIGLQGEKVRFPGRIGAVIIFKSGRRQFGILADHLYPTEIKEVNPHPWGVGIVAKNMTSGSFDWEDTDGVVLRPDELVRTYIMNFDLGRIQEC